MSITIRQVDAFMMVAELRSFTAAGAALHITQSAVSNLVKDLEDQIGVQLFDRGRRVVKLTAAGKIIFEKASRNCTMPASTGYASRRRRFWAVR